MLRILVISLRCIATSALLVCPVVAYSAPPWTLSPIAGGFAEPQLPSVGQSFMTPRGPAFVTGANGSMATTTIPGTARQGFLMNNGNGTSTLIVPGGVQELVATPR